MKMKVTLSRCLAVLIMGLALVVLSALLPLSGTGGGLGPYVTEYRGVPESWLVLRVNSDTGALASWRMLAIPFLVAVIWSLLVSTMILTPYWFFRSRQKRRKKEDNTQPTLPRIQE
jgi:hypothetical protein